MAIDYLDGFDKYGTGVPRLVDFWTTPGNPSCASGGRTGNMVFETTAGGGSITRLFSGARASGTVGFAVYADAWSTSDPLVEIRDGSTTHLSIGVVPTTFYLTLFRGTVAGTQLAQRTSGAMSTGTWYYIEVQYTIDDTVGSYEVRLNGTIVMSGSGADTRNGGNASADRLYIKLARPSAGNYHKFDDVYICDGASAGDFLGQVSVLTVWPTAAGATTGMSPTGAANNWDCVDDTGGTDQGSTYVSTRTKDALDTYTVQNPGSTGLIKGMQVSTVAALDSSGQRTLNHIVRSGGADYAGAGVLVNSTTYSGQRTVWQTDPATGVVWTTSGINAMEAGQKLAA